LTFRRFELLAERNQAAIKRLDHRAGIVAAVVASSFGDGSKSWSASDFFPSLLAANEEEDEEKAQQARNTKQIAIMEQWTLILGGKDLRGQKQE
jgi:hypothetical protein